MRWRLFVSVLSLCGCSRRLETSPVDAAPAEVPPARVEPRGGSLAPTPTVPEEARRSRIVRFADDKALPAAALAKHFAGSQATSYDVQVAELGLGARRVILAAEAGKPTSDARPIVVVVDEVGSVAWMKDRPVAGILPPVGPVAIAAGPRGRVAIAACDPPTKTVALRLWDDDGSPFADFQTMEIESCEALSLLYWPRKGFVIVAVTTGLTRARFVTESGSLGWVQDVGARSRAEALAPASLACDTDDTFVLVQAVQPTAERRSPFHVLAFRYDFRGQPVWPAAIDIGELSRPLAPGERAALTQTPPAGVHVSLPGLLEADLKPSGDVSRARAPR